MMKLRIALAWSVYPLFLLSIGLGAGLFHLGKALEWLSISVVRSHVSYPLIQLRRLIQREPLWKPADMMIGMMPDSPRSRSDAAKLGYVEEPVCRCGDPGCENANKKTWIHKDQLAYARQLQSMARAMGAGGIRITTDPVAPSDRTPE